MCDSLLADLQYVQLIAKEQHRRKRRLTKLNKTKRQKQESDHSHHHNHRISEWHSNKHNKYKKAEWILNIYLEYETKSIYDEDHDICNNDDDITTTTTATVIIDQRNHDDDDKLNVNVNVDNVNMDKQCNNENNNDEQELNHKLNEEDENKQEPPSSNEEETLSSYFDGIEHDFHDTQHDKTDNLQFPLTFIQHITSLYESSTSQNDINGLLKSARCWNDNECGQVVVIGSYLDELVMIFKDIHVSYPLDIIYLISELVGNPIIWLRKSGLNIFKWSSKSTIYPNNKRHSDHDLNHIIKINHIRNHKKLKKSKNIRKFKFKYKYKYKYHDETLTKNIILKEPYINNEFYFSGYIGNDTMKELLLINHHQYLDLDWCFVAFLLLGLIPKYQNQYFRCYFNQKLLAALPGTYPFKLLLNK